MMTLETFKDAVDLHSADLSRWPQDEMKAAIAFMQADAQARAYFDAALKLDDALRHYEPALPDMPALEKRILQGLAQQAPKERKPAAMPAASLFALPLRWLVAPGGALLAAAVFGFFLGFTPPAAPHSDTLVDPVYYAQDQIISGDADLYDQEVY